MMIRKYKDTSPEIHTSAYVDPQAHVSGDVVLAADVSVWPMAVLRGDVHKIRVGKARIFRMGRYAMFRMTVNSNPVVGR